MKEIYKENGNLKLSLDVSLNIYEDKLSNLEKTIKFQKEKNRTDLEKVWKDNHKFPEKLEDLED